MQWTIVILGVPFIGGILGHFGHDRVDLGLGTAQFTIFAHFSIWVGKSLIFGVDRSIWGLGTARFGPPRPLGGIWPSDFHRFDLPRGSKVQIRCPELLVTESTPIRCEVGSDSCAQWKGR